MVFVDLGAYNGDTIREFLNWGWAYGNPSKFKIYAFEPNQKFAPIFRDMHVKYSPKAAWVKDGETTFALDSTETPMGSTLMSSKTAIWDHHPHIKVKTFDFSKWIERFRDEFLIVKMDIEGAEFEVLEKLIQDDNVKIIDHLWVEFHPNKVRDYTGQDVERLAGQLSQMTNFRPWH